MQAVIKSGSKQYLVQKGQVLRVELVGETKKLEFEPLLVIDGTKVNVGTPLVKGAKVKAEVISEVKADKVKVLKYRPKKRYHKLTGHRQKYCEIKIIDIA